MNEGFETLKNIGLQVKVYEAPHYTLSPKQQQAANNIFPVMHHQPQFYAGQKREHVMPWFTYKDDTVFAPSSIGYVDAVNTDSVNEILSQMDVLAKILPDPIVVVFFHPFMTEMPERENDLDALIQGTRSRGYRFVDTLSELVVQ